MTEIREIPIQFPSDPVQCELIATLLRDKGFHELSRQIRVALKEQMKPTVEEPTEFGSIVRAKFGGKPAELWTNTPWHGEHYWRTEGGWSAVWPELTDVEVLRIGVGEAQPLAQWESDLLNEQYRRDVAAAVLAAMDVDQYLIDAVANARPL